MQRSVANRDGATLLQRVLLVGLLVAGISASIWGLALVFGPASGLSGQ